MPRALTPKQEAFCLAYLETGNASEAYRRAYDAGNMAASTIKSNACRLLKNSNVAATVAQRQQEATRAAVVTVEDIIRRAWEIASQDKGDRTAALALLAKRFPEFNGQHESAPPAPSEPLTSDIEQARSRLRLV